MVELTTDDCKFLSHTMCRNFWFEETSEGLVKADFFDLHNTFNKGKFICPRRQPEDAWVPDTGTMLFYDDKVSALLSFKSFCYHFSLGNTALAWDAMDEDWVVITDAIAWEE